MNMNMLFEMTLGPRPETVGSAWGTAYSVVAARPSLGIDVPMTAYFAEALASLLWQAHGEDDRGTDTMTFGPWIVTTETEVDWVATNGGDPEVCVFEVLYHGHDMDEPLHVATVDMDGLWG